MTADLIYSQLPSQLEVSSPCANKITWTSPAGKTHNQTDHILIDRIWHSSVLDIRSFRGVGWDTNHNLVAEKLKERLVVGR
jgi:hypothetical protein